MIVYNDHAVNFSGNVIGLCAELGCIIKEMYNAGINKDGILTDCILAVVKDSADSLEILGALAKPNLNSYKKESEEN